jgi:glucosylceramidase
MHKKEYGMNNIESVATTQTSQWQKKDQATISPSLDSKWDVEAFVDKPLQIIKGFGACFNELGWTSLSALDTEDRESILRDLFSPGVGLNFNTCDRFHVRGRFVPYVRGRMMSTQATGQD